MVPGDATRRRPLNARSSPPMNRIYLHLHEPLVSYGVTDDDEPHELAGIVVRETLDKLFIQEVIHPGGNLDVDVSRSHNVEDALVVPEAFSISEYAIDDYANGYRVEFVAGHLERDYTYTFEARVPRDGQSDVHVDRAAIVHTTPTPDKQYA